MSEFNLTYSTEGSQQESKVIKSGEILFLVGANGKGKSTLMHKFSKDNHAHVRRITAHRQVWFHSNTIDLTPASRLQTESNIQNRDLNADARYRDDHAAQRSQVTIFDLIDSENIEARKIADAMRAGKVDEAQKLAETQAPMAKLNEILKMANLDVEIRVDKGSQLLAVRGKSEPYSIAELSDGERNALLIAANVLTVPKNTLILLDEPERHLHRSIVSPLLSTLLKFREDCAFVISTHDVSLPTDQNKAAALLCRSYSHKPQYWVIDYIPAVQEMEELTAEAVLGSRRKILFIEGKASSLDLQIYQILFPEVSIKPLGSCIEIERVVKGLNSSSGHHWVSAIGIIDRDNRTDEECSMLIEQNIIPIQQYSVESIYYHPTVFKGVLDRVANIHGIDTKETLSFLTDDFLKSFRPHLERMASRLVERKIRDHIISISPNWKAIKNGNCEITLSTQSQFETELKLINMLIENKDITSIICRYPVRETPALETVSKALGFQSKDRYEQAVRIMLIDDEKERNKVLDLLQPVTDKIK